MNESVPLSQRYEFQPKQKSYALIIGVLNEGEKITQQLVKLQPYRQQVDIILVDGGSDDGATSVDALRDTVRTLLINQDRQRGLSVQYRIALHYALAEDYQGIIMMDGNGKDGPDAIPRFIEKLEAGYDFVQGSRFLKGSHHENTPVDRVLGVRLVFSPIMSLGSGFFYTDAINGFKGCSSSFLRDPRVQPFRSVFVRYSLQYYLNYIAPKLKLRVTEIPVSRVYRKDGLPHSKIIGLRARFKILGEMFATVLGHYNVK
jgi:dolichol-phosphate mannosyltransferase